MSKWKRCPNCSGVMHQFESLWVCDTKKSDEPCHAMYDADVQYLGKAPLKKIECGCEGPFCFVGCTEESEPSAYDKIIAFWDKAATREIVEIPEVPPLRPEPPRDAYSRYLIQFPGESGPRAMTRVSTVKDLLTDKFNLNQWTQRAVLAGIAYSPELLVEVQEILSKVHDGSEFRSRSLNKDLNSIIQSCIDVSGSGNAADRGTRVHAYTEYLDTGTPIEIDPSMLPATRAYQSALAAYGLEPVEVEVIGWTAESGENIAGTIDRIYRVTKIISDENHTLYPGDLVVGDLKTGNVEYGLGISLQMWFYQRFRSLYDPVTETHREMPSVRQDAAVIVKVDVAESSCDIHLVHTGPEVGEWAKMTNKIRQARRSDKNLIKPAYVVNKPEVKTPFEEATSQASPGDVDLIGWLQACTTRAEVVSAGQLWNTRGHWSDSASRLCKARATELPT